MAQMKPGSGLFCKDDIPCGDHIFHRIADTGKPHFSGVLVFIDTASADHILVFAVGKYRDIMSGCDLHSLTVQAHIHHRLSVLADRRRSCLDHAFDVRQLLPLLLPGDGSDLQYMDRCHGLCFVVYIADSVSAVDHRFGIGHG